MICPYKPSLPGIIAIRSEKGEGIARTETAVADKLQSDENLNEREISKKQILIGEEGETKIRE